MRFAEEDLLPGLAAIGGLEDAAVVIGPEQVAQGGDVNDVGISRMNAHRADVIGILQPHVLPGFAGIRGLVDAVAIGSIAADVGLAHADIDRVGVRFRNADRAHRSGFELAIGNRNPVGPSIVGSPYTAACPAEIVHARLRGHARDSHGAAASKRADIAILQLLERVEIGLRR